MSRLLVSLFSSPASAIGSGISLVFLLVALLGPQLAPYGLNEQIYTEARLPPSTAHWFGTDNLGRDVFSRVLFGAGDILRLAGLGTLLSVAAGSFLGLVSGYAGGFFDEALMRLFDSLLAIPALLLALLLLGALGPSENNLLAVIVIVYTPIVARVVRSVVLDVKTRAYVDQAKLQGESLWRILFREIFPSVLPALTVEASLRFSYAIFLVASLGFLGVGVQPPSANWGRMVNEARAHTAQLPWTMLFPASAIALLVVGANLMADGFRNALRQGGR